MVIYQQHETDLVPGTERCCPDQAGSPLARARIGDELEPPALQSPNLKNSAPRSTPFGGGERAREACLFMYDVFSVLVFAGAGYYFRVLKRAGAAQEAIRCCCCELTLGRADRWRELGSARHSDGRNDRALDLCSRLWVNLADSRHQPARCQHTLTRDETCGVGDDDWRGAVGGGKGSGCATDLRGRGRRRFR